MDIKFYIVGGYVRDRLLGRDGKDHDFVVTGATHQDMIALGFHLIEAQSFPVYHHPKTRDEYALARTEKKTGPGYHGFETNSDPSVTLEEDLHRRDLTVNAMAREVIGWNESGFAKLSDEIIDPFGGQKDLRNGILRHVSDAFGEDPVRVLRLARFAARYNFIPAPETLALMMDMVRSGELDHLTAERIWNEFNRAMGEPYPEKFIINMVSCGAMERIFNWRGPSLTVLNMVTNTALYREPPWRSLMMVFLGVERSHVERMMDIMKVPTFERKLIIAFSQIGDRITHNLDPQRYLDDLKELGAFRSHIDNPFFFEIVATASFLREDMAVFWLDSLMKAYRAAEPVRAKMIDNIDNLVGKEVGDAIDAMRLERIRYAIS